MRDFFLRLLLRRTSARTVQKTEAVLQEAQEQAERIVRETHFFTRRVQLDISRLLRETGEEVTKQARRDAQELHEKMLTAAKQQLVVFSGQLSEEMQDTTQRLATDAQRAQEKIRGEIDAYRARREAELEAQLAKNLPLIVREVTGRVIPLTEHKRLIKEALERARQEGW